MKRRTLTVTVLAVVAVIAAALVLTGTYMVSFATACMCPRRGRPTEAR